MNKGQPVLTVKQIAWLVENETDISVTYYWHSHSDKPVANIKRVDVFFKQPHVGLWKYLMTSLTDNFEISIFGTRNQPHDGLDDCYAAVLDEVNAERDKIGLERVNR